MRILIVEPGTRNSEQLSGVLLEYGYLVERIATAAECHELAVRTIADFDAILIAAKLPDGDGIDTCRCLRERGIAAPILIMLDDCSENEANEHAVRIWDAGADGFHVDPTRDYNLFLARLRALLRRGVATPGNTLRAGDIEMDLARRSVSRAGRRMELTNKEFELLHALMRSPNRVLSRTAIGARVWGNYIDTDSNVIDVCMHHLRVKLNAAGGECPIKTVRGLGYMLVIDSEPIVQDAEHTPDSAAPADSHAVKRQPSRPLRKRINGKDST